jgi:hypothetical protein
MIIAVEFSVSRVWVFDQLWRPSEERFPFDLLYELVDWFFKDRPEGPKRRDSKIFRTRQAGLDRAGGFGVKTLGSVFVYAGVVPLPSSSKRTNWSILFISFTKLDG